MALTKIINQGVATSGLPAGSVLQVVNATFSSVVSTSSTSFVSLGSPAIQATITPTSSSNKILIRFSCGIYTNNSGEAAYTTVYRGTVASGTHLGEGAEGMGRLQTITAQHLDNMVFEVMDSPSTTSATTYQIGFRSSNAALKYFCHNNRPNELILMEIAT